MQIMQHCELRYGSLVKCFFTPLEESRIMFYNLYTLIITCTFVKILFSFSIYCKRLII